MGHFWDISSYEVEAATSDLKKIDCVSCAYVEQRLEAVMKAKKATLKNLEFFMQIYNVLDQFDINKFFVRSSRPL